MPRGSDVSEDHPSLRRRSLRDPCVCTGAKRLPQRPKARSNDSNVLRARGFRIRG